MIIELEARLIFSFCGLILMLSIFQWIRKGKLKEKYALMWLPLGFGCLVVGVYPEMLLYVSETLHLHYLTVALLGAIVFFTLVLLYLTTRISQMREDMKQMAQEMALLHKRTSDLTDIIQNQQFISSNKVDESAPSWSAKPIPNPKINY